MYWFLESTTDSAAGFPAASGTEPLFASSDNERYLYFSGKQTGNGPALDPTALNIYAYDLETDEVIPISSGGSLYNFTLDKNDRYILAFGPYAEFVDESITTPEVPFWFDLKDRTYNNLAIPWGFHKHALTAGQELVAYQQHLSGDNDADEYRDVQSWETIIYAEETGRYVQLSGLVQPNFVYDDSRVLLLGADGVYLYDPVQGTMLSSAELEVDLDAYTQMALAADGSILVLSSATGQYVYQVEDLDSLELEQLHEIPGAFGSTIMSESGPHYFSVSLQESDSDGVSVEQRAIESGVVERTIELEGFIVENITLDELHPLLITESFLTTNY